MSIKLIGFILVLFVVILFIGLNLDNSSDIQIWFGDKGHLQNISILVSFFVMYLIGVLSVVPFMMSWQVKKKSIEKKADPDQDIGKGKRKEGMKKSFVHKRRRKESGNKMDVAKDDMCGGLDGTPPL